MGGVRLMTGNQYCRYLRAKERQAQTAQGPEALQGTAQGPSKAQGNPRRANGHKRDKIRKRIAARGEPCAICGKPIDYSLPAGDEYAFEVDEIVPVRDGGNPLDIRNCRPTHRKCNRERYQQERAEQLEAQSLPKATRKW